MFGTEEENNQGAQQPVHVMDQPLQIGSFDDDDIPLFQTASTEIAAATTEKTDDAGADNGGADGKSKFNAFDDEAVIDDKSKTTPDEDEALIEKLKAKGFKIEKEDVVNEDEVFQRNLAQAETAIAQAQKFIELPDTKMVSEKLKWDLAEKYRKVGKEHLINSEEFEIELEAEVDSYSSDDRMLKIYADNIRRDIKDGVLSKSIKTKQDLIDSQTKKIEGEIESKKTELKKSFNQIFEKGFLGMNFEKKDIQEAFDYISTGKFSKEIKDDPNSLAELALYRLNREKIVSKIGGPTYNEGVADAVQALEGKDKSSTSHISNAMRTQAGKGGEESISSKWSSVLAPDSEKLKDKEVI